MRMFKLIGSGPLAGLVVYGEIAHDQTNRLAGQEVRLKLDEEAHVLDTTVSHVTMSVLSGMMRFRDGTETNLLRVDIHDLRQWWEVAEWRP